MSFLKAHWKKLIMMNYEVQPDLLQPYLPAGTELDTYEGKHYVSLVGFLFDETRILGCSIPLHTKFEEINLRFYVKRFENGEWKRGVVFIKEIVPRYMICAVANLMYNENYVYLPMKHSMIMNEGLLTIQYHWKDHTMKAVVASEAKEMLPGSLEEFIAEHYWGYSKISETKTSEYEVVHPRWRIHEVKEYALNCDFHSLYGSEFSICNHQAPASVLVAEGSEVEVKGRRVIKI